MKEQLRQVGSSAAFSAFIMLIVGFGFALKGISSNQTYNAAVATTTWAMRIGGLGMVLVAAVCFAEQRIGFLLDAIIGMGSGVLIFVASAMCIVLGRGFDIRDAMFCFIGLLAAGAARNSWGLYRSTASQSAGGSSSGWFGGRSSKQAAPVAPPPPEPIHPASVRPASLASDTPPPGGYLAALGRENAKPDRAEFE